MNHEQYQINDKILQSLDDIQVQNRQIVQKIDNLEKTVTKRATLAGAMAGAITGSVTSGMVSVGFELIRAKFGG